MGKVVPVAELLEYRAEWRGQGKITVFTNGVFDILHRGHCEYLAAAKTLGDLLIVGLNSDSSVKRIKGEKKPIVPEADRAVVLSMLASVDFVVLFDEETPQRLISEILPDVLVKGGDYSLDAIVGRTEVEQAGGRVLTVPLTPEKSSTNIIQTILDRFCT
jgi:rfaE bifunctional protein nucleotidyltransferase chain/domain